LLLLVIGAPALGFGPEEATTGLVIPGADVSTPVNAVPVSGAELSYPALGDPEVGGVIGAGASGAPVDAVEFVASVGPRCPVSARSLVDFCWVVGVAMKAVATEGFCSVGCSKSKPPTLTRVTAAMPSSTGCRTVRRGARK
jgi:hypothetical protein